MTSYVDLEPFSHLSINPNCSSLPLFDRSNWTRVRFGDVVLNVTSAVGGPGAAGIERFIGLEHLDRGSLRVRSWGNLADGTTFTRRCAPGQVLFGKRRAYQRKVAVADFEAVVSGDIYVLAPKDKRLLPQLLPFLCMSERFFQHAVETSAGSLSPRTNWTSLANFEFDLPPRDQQRRIVDILWAAEQVRVTTLDLSAACQLTRSPRMSQMLNIEGRACEFIELGLRELPANWSVQKLRDLVVAGDHSLLAGPFGTIFKAKDFRKSGIRIIQLRHVTEEGFIWGDNETFMDMDVFQRVHRPYLVQPNDLLITKMGEPPGVACIYPAGAPPAMVTPDIVKATIDGDKADLRYLKHLYNSAFIRARVQRLIKGATRPRVSLNEFFAIDLPMPPIDEQKRIADSLDAIETSIESARRSAKLARALANTLTAALFS